MDKFDETSDKIYFFAFGDIDNLLFSTDKDLKDPTVLLDQTALKEYGIYMF